ncbi:hypothetical protein C7N43_13280 [Sphingobacteriales bacterium UPWRP_1]|nr:hypothetical protein C7N43_13280 [Sphingobacteriales bacterium UPWRP_1]
MGFPLPKDNKFATAKKQKGITGRNLGISGRILGITGFGGCFFWGNYWHFISPLLCSSAGGTPKGVGIIGHFLSLVVSCIYLPAGAA